jgi:hypothetical protein
MLKFFIGQNARTGERAMGGCIYSGEPTKLDPFQRGGGVTVAEDKTVVEMC